MRLILPLFIILLSLSTFADSTVVTCQFASCEGDSNFDKVIIENSSKPIIYGVGLAGMTFDTTYEESKKSLVEPIRGPLADGSALYREQIYIHWDLEKDKKPLFLLAFPGYLGEIQIQKPVGKIQDNFGLNEEFSSYISEVPEGGAEQLAIDLYQAFTGSVQNCLEYKVCSVDWGDDSREFFLITTPGMILRFTKNQFIPLVVLVQKVQ